jgi:cellulose synthase/poly-beta-1,6-N-acetylglucosamine synthase-like glycosyltransferase
MTQPLVTVVIPCYNMREYLPEAIGSVQEQDYPNIKIIVVDDGSTDGSTDTFEESDRLWLRRLHRNFGPCVACELGFAYAEGEYVCMLAADDMFISHSHIGEQVDVLERTGADWCYNTKMLSGKTWCSAKTIQSKWLLTHHLDNLVLKIPVLCSFLLGFRNPVNSSAMMFRTSSYKANSLSWMLFGARSACDGGILTTMFEAGMRGVAIHNQGSFYRIHAKQVSNDPDFIREVQQRKKESFGRFFHLWRWI